MDLLILSLVKLQTPYYSAAVVAAAAMCHDFHLEMCFG